MTFFRIFSFLQPKCADIGARLTVLNIMVKQSKRLITEFKLGGYCNGNGQSPELSKEDINILGNG